LYTGTANTSATIEVALSRTVLNDGIEPPWFSPCGRLASIGQPSSPELVRY
jgi:hypothetical protein